MLKGQRFFCPRRAGVICLHFRRSFGNDPRKPGAFCQQTDTEKKGTKDTPGTGAASTKWQQLCRSMDTIKGLFFCFFYFFFAAKRVKLRAAAIAAGALRFEWVGGALMARMQPPGGS